MRVIVAAAGTGGHINPALAIANKIAEENPNSEIIFYGTKRGLENDLVPRAGYELKHIDAYGMQAKMNFTDRKSHTDLLTPNGVRIFVSGVSREQIRLFFHCPVQKLLPDLKPVFCKRKLPLQRDSPVARRMRRAPQKDICRVCPDYFQWSRVKPSGRRP